MPFYSFSQVEVWSEVFHNTVPSTPAHLSTEKEPTLYVTGRAQLQKQDRKQERQQVRLNQWVMSQASSPQYLTDILSSTATMLDVCSSHP